MIDKAFISLFITGMSIELSHVGAGLVDGMMVGSFLGPDALAAEGIAHPIYSIIGILSGMLFVGMQVCCAQELGRGRLKKVSEVFSITVYVGTILSVIMTVLTVMFSGKLAILLGATGKAADIAQMASEYISGIGIGIPAIVLTAIFGSALQLDNSHRIVVMGAVIEIVTDIIFDVAAVYFNWGIFGMGLATSIAAYANLLYMWMAHFSKKSRNLYFVRPEITPEEFMKMLGNGTDKACVRLANTLRPVIVNRMIILYGGTAAMTALSAQNSYSGFLNALSFGIASAVSVLTSLFYGEINEDGIREVVSFKHKMIACVCGLISILVIVLRKPVASFYINEAGSIFDMVCFSFVMLALQLPIRALIDSRIKYLQGIQRLLNMNILIFAARFIVVVVTAFICGKLFGVYGILASCAVSDSVTLLLVYVYYMIRSGKFIPSRKDFLNLPEEFYPNPGDIISLDIRNHEEASLAAEQLMLFAKGHGFDKKTSLHASLTLQELADNIIEHGFTKKQLQDNMIDFRAVYKTGKLVIIIRDNCPKYDVTAKIAEVNAEGSDPGRNIGIRIISKTASNIKYLNTLEMNNIIFELNNTVFG